jgi:hypothetical protein
MIKLIANGLAIRSSILSLEAELVRSGATRAVTALHCALFKRRFPR